MKRSFVLLVVAIFGLSLRVLAQDKATDKATDKTAANHHATARVCVAGHAAATSALVNAREAGQVTAPGGEKQQGLLAALREWPTEADDRAYLRETAWSSATMTRQGPQTAIARLNPKFATRLASAIREARGAGLPLAGIFSAYRPPSFGVGRFLDRFNSLHAYGLAVDLLGIGEPHSNEAKLWYDIAGRHGIVCPYGVDSGREWNHCQPTPAKAVCRDDPLRRTITAEGPLDLEEMFKAGDRFVDNPPGPCIVVAANRPAASDAVTPSVTPQIASQSTSHAAPATHSAPAPHVAPTTSGAASTRSDRKHMHDARNVDGDAITRSRRSSDDELMRMVSHDMGLPLGSSRGHEARRGRRSPPVSHDRLARRAETDAGRDAPRPTHGHSSADRGVAGDKHGRPQSAQGSGGSSRHRAAPAPPRSRRG